MATFTANSTQLLYGSKVYEVLQYYYSPAGANAVTGLQNTLYAFIGDVRSEEHTSELQSH